MLAPSQNHPNYSCDIVISEIFASTLKIYIICLIYENYKIIFQSIKAVPHRWSAYNLGSLEGAECHCNEWKFVKDYIALQDN